MGKKMINVTCCCCGGSFKVPVEYLTGNVPPEGAKMCLGFGAGGDCVVRTLTLKKDGMPLQLLYTWNVSSPAGDLCPSCCCVGMAHIIADTLKDPKTTQRMKTGEGYGVGGTIDLTKRKDEDL